LAAAKPLEIWWQDEARIGQKGTLTRLWARRGSRPPAPRDTRHSSAYLFGAVCPDRGTGAALVFPRVNAEAMSLHLAKIGKSVRPDAHAIVIFDGAGWHQTGRRLIVPENITLLLFPPYAPELNPTENIWQFLRQNMLSHRVWKTYDAIVDACCTAWNSLIADPQRITSIASREWPKVS